MWEQCYFHPNSIVFPPKYCVVFSRIPTIQAYFAVFWAAWIRRILSLWYYCVFRCILEYNRIPVNTQEYISTIHVLRWPLVPRINTTQYIRKYMYCDNTSKYLLIQRNTRYDTCIATIDINTLKYITKYTYFRRLIWIHVDTFAIQIGYMYFCRPSRILWNMIEIQQ